MEYQDRADDVAWPGFVDILSTVIMMFVFFVMILSIVMFVLSINHKKITETEAENKVQREIQMIQSQILEKNDMSAEEFELQIEKITELNALTAQNEQLNSEITRLKADLAKAVKQNAVLNQAGDTLTVLFQKTEITLTEMSEQMIREFIENAQAGNAGPISIVLEAGDSPDAPSISLSRELALARTLNVRNVLLGVPVEPNRVKLQYKEPELVEETYHWVKIKVLHE